ncbi:MAG: sensor histidine kinase [Dethiobacter sp.]|nr:MAG: sensor histidine kinase [Dethiobacter sp.]
MENIEKSNLHRLKMKIVEILHRKREKILNQFYRAYCLRIKEFDNRGRALETLEQICLPVKRRFSLKLDRFMEVLMNGDYNYKFEEIEKDVEYALKFIIPAQYKDLRSHDVVNMTRSFVTAATSAVLEEINPLEYSVTKEGIVNLMNELVYITFEDLWVSSVIGFRHQNSMIQKLLSRLMTIQEEERQNFWREIHDHFLQILAIIPVKLEIIKELSSKDLKAMEEEIRRFKGMIKKVTGEIRSSCQSFSFSWIENRGLSFSLKKLAEIFEKQFELQVNLDIHEKASLIKGFSGATLFRIIQEALYNVAKHAEAKEAKVKIDIENEYVFVTIEDNGIGFDVKEVLKKDLDNHLGLNFMRERVISLNGFLRIKSNKHKGTKIIVKIPLKVFENYKNIEKKQ